MQIVELKKTRLREQTGLIGDTKVTARQVPPGSDESETTIINPALFRQQLNTAMKAWRTTVDYQMTQMNLNRADSINSQAPGMLRGVVRDIVERRILGGNPQLATISQYDAKAGTTYADEITRYINAIADDPDGSGVEQNWYQLLLRLQAVQWMSIKGIPEAAPQQSTTQLTPQGEIERQRFAGAAQQALSAVPSIRTMPVPPTGNPHLNALLAAMGILRGYVPPAQGEQ